MDNVSNLVKVVAALLRGCLTAIRRVSSVLKCLLLRAYSWCRRHPVLLTLGLCLTLIIGILMSLLFAVSLGGRSQAQNVIIGESHSGVRYSLGLVQVRHVTHTTLHRPLDHPSRAHLHDRCGQKDYQYFVAHRRMRTWIYGPEVLPLL
jgi:hypothetical protein